MSETNGKGPAAKVRIHFVEVEIRNHMRVQRAKVFLPERGVVPISGQNRSGKTSFKRSLAALVGGDAEVEEAPRNRDAGEDEEAYIVSVLSDGTTLRPRDSRRHALPPVCTSVSARFEMAQPSWHGRCTPLVSKHSGTIRAGRPSTLHTRRTT